MYSTGTGSDLRAFTFLADTLENGAGYCTHVGSPEVLTTRELTEAAATALGRPVSEMQVPLEEWAAGPGAGLTEQARADLLAMFTAYDDGGLVGDPTVLPRLLGRPATTWVTRLSQWGSAPSHR